MTIDQKTVTAEEARAGVPIYVRVDTPLLNAIEFGTHVDDEATYTVVTSISSAAEKGGEMLDIEMTTRDSEVWQNMTWYTYASMSPNSAVSTNFWNGSRSVMNLVMLNVKIPDPIPDKVYKIEYLDRGVVRANGKSSVEIWKNTFGKTDNYGASFEAVLIYVALGIISAEMGGFILNPTKQPQQQQLPLRPQPPQLLQQLPPLNRQPPQLPLLHVLLKLSTLILTER